MCSTQLSTYFEQFGCCLPTLYLLGTQWLPQVNAEYALKIQKVFCVQPASQNDTTPRTYGTFGNTTLTESCLSPNLSTTLLLSTNLSHASLLSVGVSNAQPSLKATIAHWLASSQDLTTSQVINDTTLQLQISYTSKVTHQQAASKVQALKQQLLQQANVAMQIYGMLPNNFFNIVEVV